jgi:hypothetical protein
MPTLPDILNQVQFVTQEVLLLGLFLTAGVILVGRDWRLLIMALLGQYILIGLILARLVRPDIALLKIMIGAFICPILFISARQVSTNPALVSLFSKQRGPTPSATGFVLRVFVALLMILVTITLSEMFAIPHLPQNITIAVYWLVLAGLTVLILTEDPLKVGHGLLTILAGFNLLYTIFERSLLMTGLWGAVNLLIALAISYLIVARGANPEEEP